jgi:chorismate mutase
MNTTRIWAARGATTIEEDSPTAVAVGTKELLVELFRQNRIQPDDIVSIIFTVTPDICSQFPAVAARELGLDHTPLMCAQEIPKPGALPHCIRLLVHFYTDLAKNELQPVYLHDAIKLRPDLNLKSL